MKFLVASTIGWLKSRAARSIALKPSAAFLPNTPSRAIPSLLNSAEVLADALAKLATPRIAAAAAAAAPSLPAN